MRPFSSLTIARNHQEIMSWTEIIIEVERTQAEALSDALMGIGVLSVSVEDAEVGTEAEQNRYSANPTWS